MQNGTSTSQSHIETRNGFQLNDVVRVSVCFVVSLLNVLDTLLSRIEHTLTHTPNERERERETKLQFLPFICISYARATYSFRATGESSYERRETNTRNEMKYTDDLPRLHLQLRDCSNQKTKTKQHTAPRWMRNRLHMKGEAKILSSNREHQLIVEITSANEFSFWIFFFHFNFNFFVFFFVIDETSAERKSANSMICTKLTANELPTPPKQNQKENGTEWRRVVKIKKSPSVLFEYMHSLSLSIAHWSFRYKCAVEWRHGIVVLNRIDEYATFISAHRHSETNEYPYRDARFLFSQLDMLSCQRKQEDETETTTRKNRISIPQR